MMYAVGNSVWRKSDQMQRHIEQAREILFTCVWFRKKKEKKEKKSGQMLRHIYQILPLFSEINQLSFCVATASSIKYLNCVRLDLFLGILGHSICGFLALSVWPMVRVRGRSVWGGKTLTLGSGARRSRPGWEDFNHLMEL